MTKPSNPDSRTLRVHLALASSANSLPSEWDQHWMYLGDDFATLLRLRAGWDGDKRRLGSAQTLFQVAAELIPTIIQELGAESARHGDSLEWWFTDLAGKNVLVSRFFLRLAYAEMFRRELTQLQQNPGKQEVLVICGDVFVFQVIRQLAAELGLITVTDLNYLTARAIPQLRLGIRWIGRWLLGLTTTFTRLIAARLTNPRVPTKVLRTDVLLHTCVDESCFQLDGTFRDRYFPGLQMWSRSHGVEVATIPWLFSFSRSWRAAYRWLRSSKETFLVLEDYMSFADLPRAIWRVLRSGRWLGPSKRIAGIDVSSLLRHERLESSSNARALILQMYPMALKRWIAAGGRCQSLIDMFENMGAERPLVWAFRHYSPETELVGYQHIGGIPSQQISYSVTPGELATGIFPDRIVANSTFTAETMCQSGFPRAMLSVGPALRFQHLFKYRNCDVGLMPEKREAQNQVLLLLPLEMGAALELVYFCLGIIAQLVEAGIGIVAKCHPMMQLKTLEQALGRDSWPTIWEWGNQPTDSYFARTLFVVAEGSSLLDAAAAGIPFVALHRELRPALNPLSFWSERFPCTRNRDATELKAGLSEFIAESRQSSPERVALAREILSGLGPVDDSTMAVFLPRNVRLDAAKNSLRQAS